MGPVYHVPEHNRIFQHMQNFYWINLQCSGTRYIDIYIYILAFRCKKGNVSG